LTASMTSTTQESNCRCVAIIPARGGSKGLPRKNILPLEGKPLIAYTILAARAARSIQRTIVSTESAEIAEVAREYGAEVPFLRPLELAQDDTPTLPVLKHVLNQIEAAEGSKPEIVVVLQPTSPLRKAADVDAAVRLLEQTQADSVISVCAVEHHPALMKRLESDRLVPLLPNSPEYARRQDLPPVYRPNGAIYVTRRQVLLDNHIMGPDTRALLMDAESSVDIDTRLDLKIAGLIMQERINAGA
jgi:CMP-N,N'-diacetyllegionaminic acid synthase